jgi:sterol desaturase/sphingolipid hydroxylase (fatty acid hydroxylase superfamily)
MVAVGQAGMATTVWEAGLLSSEPWIRIGIGAGVFAAMAAWEVIAPRRFQPIGRWIRWPNNLGVLIIDTTLLRLLFPAAAVGVALGGKERGWGLLNNLPPPHWIAVIALDLAIYFQHVLFYAVPVLWRLHRMHHADLEFDVTTGVRFHPVEILLSMVIKIGVVVALGAPALAILIFRGAAQCDLDV